MSLQFLLLLVVAFQVFYLAYVLFQPSQIPIPVAELSSANKTIVKKRQVPHFIDSSIANKLLRRFDEYIPVPESIWKHEEGGNNKYNETFLGLVRNPDYCNESRKYFTQNSAEYFGPVKFFTDYARTTLPRNLVKWVGIDAQQGISRTAKKKNLEPKTKVRKDIQFFLANLGMGRYQEIGKDFACSHQTYGHIPGHKILTRKDLVAKAVKKYSKLYKGAQNHCFTFDKFFPETFLLDKEEQCLEFFEKINSQEYVKLKEKYNIVYIRKKGKGRHQGADVEIFNNDEENLIRSQYQNGKLCGSVKLDYLLQKFISNPLLLYGHKFDFRMYMMIASTNPFIAYYHDGFLRVSLEPYDTTSTQKGTFITNTHLAMELIEKAEKGELVYGMNYDELTDFQVWTLERLQDYLIETEKIADQNWLNSYLRPEFKRAYIHLCLASKDGFLVRSQIFEVMGVDFMLDDELNLWFIEANARPLILGNTMNKYKLLFEMMRDMMEIQVGLLRSRLKRMINFVNKLTKEILERENAEIKDKDIDKNMREFKKLMRNKFEPELVPKKENTWKLIVDFNLNGIDRFNGLIDSKCILSDNQ